MTDFLKLSETIRIRLENGQWCVQVFGPVGMMLRVFGTAPEDMKPYFEEALRFCEKMDANRARALAQAAMLKASGEQ